MSEYPYPSQPPSDSQPEPTQPYGIPDDAPGQPYFSQPQGEQSYAGQPYGGQPYGAQPPSGSPYSGQPGDPYGGAQYPQQAYYTGQPYPGQPYPGTPIYPGAPYLWSDKTKLAAGLLGIFLGVFGVHNFYLGFTGKAAAQLLITLLSFGILAPVSAIWGLIEAILILTSQPGSQWSFDANGAVLRQ